MRLSGDQGQFAELAAIQVAASFSVSKSPTWKKGLFPAVTTTVQVPPFLISA